MGQLPSTTNPAGMIALTSVSQALGLLFANTTTIRPSGTRAVASLNWTGAALRLAKIWSPT
jgi:hypothetical protein